VFGTTKGIQAQRALFHGGTLANGKLAVELCPSHGRMLRELVAKVRFEAGDDVCCYGGFVTLAPEEADSDTHMRHIPSTNYVLDGLPFSKCFPTRLGGVFELGYQVPLHPRCVTPAWEKVIETSGIGYIANTITKCPLGRTRPNVIVCEAMLGRTIPGVPYPSIMTLRASTGGIDVGERIISQYESWKQTKKFEFVCVDEAHYRAAGRVQQLVEGSDSARNE
jgi:hypothetical protein